MNLNSIMLGTDEPRRLADFYTRVLGEPVWKDEESQWFGYKAGDGFISIGPHSEVAGKNNEPGRIILNYATDDVQGEFERIKATGAEVVAEPYQPGGAGGMWLATFADADGNYFQLATPWEEEASQ